MNMTPRLVSSDTCRRGKFPSDVSINCLRLFNDLQIVMNLHFVILKNICQSELHNIILLMSFCNCKSADVMILNNLVSSANNHRELSTRLGKSLIEMINMVVGLMHCPVVHHYIQETNGRMCP